MKVAPTQSPGDPGAVFRALANDATPVAEKLLADKDIGIEGAALEDAINGRLNIGNATARVV
ncbi:MAG: hypothetical protein KF705_08915 [Phycisphaeraceae bacterium]|nr:hypothetical protein [Phycisphaeraceae bacterium]